LHSFAQTHIVDMTMFHVEHIGGVFCDDALYKLTFTLHVPQVVHHCTVGSLTYRCR